MSDTLLDLWTIALHEEFTEHKDAKSGLSKDCERCREMAESLFAIQKFCEDADHDEEAKASPTGNRPICRAKAIIAKAEGRS